MKNKTIFSSQTAQSGVRIEQSGDDLQLKFDSDTDAIQSSVNRLHPQRLSMENLRYLMGILLFIPPPRKVLLLGVGGGSLVHFFNHYLPEAHITGVEYDAELLGIAQQHLGLPPASERLNYVISDARDFLALSEEHYDLILVDIFTGGLSPAWLLQQQTMQQLRSRLSSNGGLAYNLLISNEKAFTRFYQLLRQVFQQQTLCLETEDYENLLVYGLNFTEAPRDMAYLIEHSESLTQTYELPFAQILAKIYDINPVDSGII